MRSRFSPALILLAATLAAPASAAAPRFAALVSENDLYVDGKDRHYTAGTHLAYGFATGAAPRWLGWLGALSPLDRGAAARDINLGFGQVIATPEDLSRASPDPEDRPYAGWLYAELAAVTHGPATEDEIGLSLGVLGSASLARQTHELLHDLTPSIEPRGWDAQLEDEPAVVLRYRRSWFIPVEPDDVWQGDLVPRAQLTLGNVFTEFALGLAWRFGSRIEQRDRPLRLAPGSGSPRFSVRPGRVDWMFRADVVGRAVAHNVLLDGSLFDDHGPRVDAHAFTWEASAGVQFTFGNLPLPAAFAFTYVWRGEEFAGQRGINRFGSIAVSLQF